MIATHIATCAASDCGAALQITPRFGWDHANRPTDAVASVVTDRRAVRHLPEVPPLVWFTCPACDGWQRR